MLVMMTQQVYFTVLRIYFYHREFKNNASERVFIGGTILEYPGGSDSTLFMDLDPVYTVYGQELWMIMKSTIFGMVLLTKTSFLS